MRIKYLQRASNHLIAIIVCLFMFVPIYLIVTNSFKETAQARAMSIDLPDTIQLENFSTVIEQGKLWKSFQNSMLYSCVSTFLGTMTAGIAAYALSRNRTRLNRAIYFYIIMGIAMPMNFFTLTRVMQITNLINTQIGIIILYAATQIPFGIFLIYGYVNAIPKELDEAAIVDGCGPLRLYFSVILPLMTPVLVTTAVLSFMGTWSEFLFPLYYLNDSDNWPMTLAVYNFFGQFETDWNLVSADILLTILPVIVVYVLGQRFIVSGMTAGSVKG